MAAQTSTRPNLAQVPNGRMAMWWVILSEIVIFGGLVASYLLYRNRYPEWGEHAAHTSTPLGALNTVVLMTSSLTVVMAHDAANRNDIPKMTRNMWISICGGLIFLCVKAFEYTTEIKHGFTITTNTFWSFYYCMTGLHGLHVIAGMIAMYFTMKEAQKGRNMHRIEMAGLYWHFVDIVWIFLFPILYISK